MLLNARKVLVVEDDPAFRELIAQMLTVSGFDPVTAATVEEATAIADRISIRVVLTDFSLTDGTGVGVMRAVKGLQPNARCIVMTGFHNAAEMITEGFDAHLLKPVGLDELVAEMRRVLLADTRISRAS